MATRRSLVFCVCRAPTRQAVESISCVVFLGCMDNFRGMLVTGHGDKFLERGIAVLAFDGPETPVVYRGEVHGMTDNLDVRALIADWIRDCFDGKSLDSRIVVIDCRSGMEVGR